MHVETNHAQAGATHLQIHTAKPKPLTRCFYVLNSAHSFTGFNAQGELKAKTAFSMSTREEFYVLHMHIIH